MNLHRRLEQLSWQQISLFLWLCLMIHPWHRLPPSWGLSWSCWGLLSMNMNTGTQTKRCFSYSWSLAGVVHLLVFVPSPTIKSSSTLIVTFPQYRQSYHSSRVRKWESMMFKLGWGNRSLTWKAEICISGVFQSSITKNSNRYSSLTITKGCKYRAYCCAKSI